MESDRVLEPLDGLTYGFRRVMDRIRMLSSALLDGAETDPNGELLSLGLEVDLDWIIGHMLRRYPQMVDFAEIIGDLSTRTVPIVLRALIARLFYAPPPLVGEITNIIADWESRMANVIHQRRRLVSVWYPLMYPLKPDGLDRIEMAVAATCLPGAVHARHPIQASAPPAKVGAESISMRLPSRHASVVRWIYEQDAILRQWQADPLVLTVRESLMAVLTTAPLVLLMAQYASPYMEHLDRYELACISHELRQSSLLVRNALVSRPPQDDTPQAGMCPNVGRKKRRWRHFRVPGDEPPRDRLTASGKIEMIQQRMRRIDQAARELPLPYERYVIFPGTFQNTDVAQQTSRAFVNTIGSWLAHFARAETSIPTAATGDAIAESANAQAANAEAANAEAANAEAADSDQRIIPAADSHLMVASVDPSADNHTTGPLGTIVSANENSDSDSGRDLAAQQAGARWSAMLNRFENAIVAMIIACPRDVDLGRWLRSSASFGRVNLHRLIEVFERTAGERLRGIALGKMCQRRRLASILRAAAADISISLLLISLLLNPS
jgi:hypothetical protein